MPQEIYYLLYKPEGESLPHYMCVLPHGNIGGDFSDDGLDGAVKQLLNIMDDEGIQNITIFNTCLDKDDLGVIIGGLESKKYVVKIKDNLNNPI